MKERSGDNFKSKQVMGFVEAVCISTEKGTVKKVVSEIILMREWGIDGDAHVGELDHGKFAENIVMRGIDLSGLIVVDSLLVGDGVLLEITRIGKECRNSGCAIQNATGECINA